jgi:hypothetical protein
MAAPVFLEYGSDGTVRSNGLHWEGFPCFAWEALSAVGYTTPPVYETIEFEHLGHLTVQPHLDHPDWFDLSSMY